MALIVPRFLDTPAGFPAAPVAARDLRAAASAGLQPGVLAAGDLKVTPNAAQVNVAAGAVLVTDSQARPAPYHCESTSSESSTTFGPLPAADPTNPRIDQIIAEVQDHNLDASGQLRWRLRVLAGTPTGGATLDNRSGAAALPVRAVRLADVLRPPAASPVTAANIRDRRPWATGAFRSILRAASSYSTTSTSPAAVDSVNLAPRIECSGVPLRLVLRGMCVYSLASGRGGVDLRQDAAASNWGADILHHNTLANIPQGFHVERVLTPTPGSHVFTPYFAAKDGGTYVIYAEATLGLTFTVEELVRQDASND